jgi:ankyrin repeat protein
VEDFVTADRSSVLMAGYGAYDDGVTTPLLCAVKRHNMQMSSRSFEIIFFLINSKADVNARVETDDGGQGVYPLWAATHDPNVCRLLIESKADVTATNEVMVELMDNGHCRSLQTALYNAQRYSNSEVIDYLRSIGAPNCYRSDRDYNSLDRDFEEHEHSYAHTCRFQSHRFIY